MISSVVNGYKKFKKQTSWAQMISVLQSKINFVKTKAVFDYYFILSWISVSVWSEQ